MDMNQPDNTQIVKLLPDTPAETDILDYRTYCETIVSI